MMDWDLSSARRLREADGLVAREATAGDLPEILAIEHKAHPTAWPRDIFERELALEQSSMWAVTQGEAVVGFLVFWLVHDEVHILNVAVEPACRRQGIATAIIECLLEMSRDFEASFITLEVRENNAAAVALYESMEFEIVGRREAYYADTGEDAFIMSCLI